MERQSFILLFHFVHIPVRPVHNAQPERGRMKGKDQVTVVITCVDPKPLEPLLGELSRRGVRDKYLITVPGGVKDLASDGENVEKQFVLRRLMFAFTRYQVEKILIVSHLGCPAYEGEALYIGEEKRIIKDHLIKAARFVERLARANLPPIPVETLFASKVENSVINLQEVTAHYQPLTMAAQAPAGQT